MPWGNFCRFRCLQEANLFRTGLSTQGLLRILTGLKGSLRHLSRGDFLCDVLDHLEWSSKEVGSELTFMIEDFWASEEYFFHTREQAKTS